MLQGQKARGLVLHCRQLIGAPGQLVPAPGVEFPCPQMGHDLPESIGQDLDCKLTVGKLLENRIALFS